VNFADRVLETIADRHIVRMGFFLINALANLRDGKGLSTVRRKIDDGASQCVAEKIFDVVSHLAQSHGQ